MKIYICGYGSIHLRGKCNCHKKNGRPHQPYALSPDLLTARPGYHLVELRTEQDGTKKLYKI